MKNPAGWYVALVLVAIAIKLYDFIPVFVFSTLFLVCHVIIVFVRVNYGKGRKRR